MESQPVPLPKLCFKISQISYHLIEIRKPLMRVRGAGSISHLDWYEDC